MVKKKEKSSVNQNFEALKAQMQAKRRLAENRFEKEAEKDISPVREVVNNTKDENTTKKEDEEYITLNIIDDEEDEIKENQTQTVNQVEELSDTLEEEIKKSNDEEDSVTQIPALNFEEPIVVEKKDEVSTADISINKIVIKKVEKQEAPKRITYYLKPETIKKIDKFSKAAGMGKSEFVQTVLEEILNNLEIEK